LSKDEFNIAECIWTLFFLSNGLRGGKTGGISWLVDPAERPDCFCDGKEGFLDNKLVFCEYRCSSSLAIDVSTVDEPCLLRPGFRLNLEKKKFIITHQAWQRLIIKNKWVIAFHKNNKP
jgi:hypothetical protein